MRTILKATSKKEISLQDIIRKEDESGVFGDILFDADYDNNGEGIEAGDFLKILKKE